jgi:hypothetical protein
LSTVPCALSPDAAGRTRISLRSSGELYSHVPPSAKVHNLVLGKTWIDSYGPFLVNCVTSGVRVEVEFKACGWFGTGQYEFEGLVLDAQVRGAVAAGGGGDGGGVCGSAAVAAGVAAGVWQRGVWQRGCGCVAVECVWWLGGAAGLLGVCVCVCACRRVHGVEVLHVTTGCCSRCSPRLRP